MILIVVNVLAVVLESVAALRLRWAGVFFTIETVSLLVFSAEYLLRDEARVIGAAMFILVAVQVDARQQAGGRFPWRNQTIFNPAVL